MTIRLLHESEAITDIATAFRAYVTDRLQEIVAPSPTDSVVPGAGHADAAADVFHVLTRRRFTDLSNRHGCAYRQAILDRVRRWQRKALPRLNGVFATAVIDSAADRLTLITDAFGFGRLYYRVANGGVWFGSCADLLRTGSETMDTVTALCVTRNGFAPGNRSLFHGIERVPAGTCLHFDGSTTPRTARWFDPASLSTGERPRSAKPI